MALAKELNKTVGLAQNLIVKDQSQHVQKNRIVKISI